VSAAVYLNGATVMTTPTQRVLEIARETGYGGIEARAERLLGDNAEVRATAANARPREVLTLNGVALTVRPDGRMDRTLIEADLAPRLEICRALGSPYLLSIPPRAPGLATRRAVDGIDGIELVLDSCHWHASGSEPLDGYPVERLALVHLNDAPDKPQRLIEDADRLLPGEGVIKLTELIANLRARGFRGPWSLETFNPAYWKDDPEDIAQRGLAAVNKIVS
jgi:sugar phosphate isomerase/epimerase